MESTQKNGTTEEKKEEPKTLFSYFSTFRYYFFRIFLYIYLAFIILFFTFMMLDIFIPSKQILPPKKKHCPKLEVINVNSSYIYLEIHLLNCPISKYDNYNLNIRIRNQDEVKDLPQGSIFTVKDVEKKIFYNNRLILPRIESYKDYEFNLTLSTTEPKTFEVIPEFFYIYINESKDIRYEYKIPIQIEWYSTFLDESIYLEKVGCLVEYIQILLFGIPGAGKSTSINTFYTSVSESVRDVVASRKSEGHQTKKIGPYLLIHDYDDNPTKNVVFFDPYGISNDNFSEYVMDALLDGRLPKDFSIEDAKRVLDFKGRYAFETKYGEKSIKDKSEKKSIKRRMHAIVFVATLESIFDTKSELSQKIKLAYEISISKNFNPIVLISHVSMDTNQTEIEELRLKVSQIIGINLKDIYVTFAYLESHKKDFKIDKQSAIIRENIILRAIDSISKSKSSDHVLRNFFKLGCPPNSWERAKIWLEYIKKNYIPFRGYGLMFKNLILFPLSVFYDFLLPIIPK